MGDSFNEGLRIEVDNDLYQDEGEVESMDEGEVEPDVGDNFQKTVQNDTNKDNTDKEDGELSGAEDETDPFLGHDALSTFHGRKSSTGSIQMQSDTEPAYKPRTYPNPFADDILVSEAKLSVRAARFGVKADPQKKTYVEQPLPSDDETLKLYVDLGLIEDDGGEPSFDKVGKQYRLNSILIRGTNEMSTNDIFSYLRDNHQRPAEMEWVNDACCVVIYKDNYQAARTLLNMTKPIHMEPKPERKLDDEDSTANSDDMMPDLDFDSVDSVSSRYVTVAIPPGYTWRFAVPCDQARGILMRYATVQDKKQEKAERHSEYYKKFGNPNYPVGHGIVTKSFRERLQKKKSFEQPASPPLEEEPLSNKAVWTQLSHRWNDEENGSVTGYKLPKQQPPAAPKQWVNRPVFERANNEPRAGRKTFKIQVDFPERLPSIKSRLKRRMESPERISRRVQDEGNSEHSSDDDDEEWSKKLKVPRMRMHADEEEERMKQRQRKAVLNPSRGRMADRLSWFDARERIPRKNQYLD